RRARRDARRAVRRADAERVEEVDVGEEALVGEHPRQTGLRIEDVLEVRSERAVLVLARGDDQEHPVAERRLLLRVDAEGLFDALQLVASVARRGLADVLCARRQVLAARR